MCLSNNIKNVKRFISRAAEKRLCYKVVKLYISNNTLYSKFKNYRWKLGINLAKNIEANIPELRKNYIYSNIDGGIHVYTTLRKAKEIKEKASNLFEKYIITILPCICYKKDLIGINFENTEAVYSQVEITKKNLIKAKTVI